MPAQNQLGIQCISKSDAFKLDPRCVKKSLKDCFGINTKVASWASAPNFLEPRLCHFFIGSLHLTTDYLLSPTLLWHIVGSCLENLPFCHRFESLHHEFFTSYEFKDDPGKLKGLSLVFRIGPWTALALIYQKCSSIRKASSKVEKRARFRASDMLEFKILDFSKAVVQTTHELQQWIRYPWNTTNLKFLGKVAWIRMDTKIKI